MQPWDKMHAHGNRRRYIPPLEFSDIWALSSQFFLELGSDIWEQFILIKFASRAREMVKWVRMLVVQAWGPEFKSTHLYYKSEMATDTCNPVLRDLAGHQPSEIQWEILFQKNTTERWGSEHHTSSPGLGTVIRTCVHVSRLYVYHIHIQTYTQEMF